MRTHCVVLILALAIAPASHAAERLAGDPEAVARVELMLERLGGAQTWARTRTLHMVYSGWRINPDEPVLEHAWRDLSRPAEFIRFKGRSFTFERAFDAEQGWMARDNEVRAMNPERLQLSLEFWPRDFYTMIRRFAVADPELRLAWEAPHRVTVYNAAGDELGWWLIDQSGQPMLWGTMDEGEKLEYVYLPVKSFGTVNFPAGGSAVDGFWRFHYETISVSIDPIPVSLQAPDNDS